ncbi:transcription elongation factor A N-terminal and central domain-containing protein [Stegastes partitus]|nr:PREDICTED: transcription elongation factor A N-terminal and central domain-containing protein [Stegastes partitus]XP_008285522.1 PREDICTED: transcription elongation factor A N-terminal and central domain-containing protein [Stegastes partitus]XP_008285523.1 PREDICTED: transcription elongation factor A N-terminal and central domain-containing protein [Stegastes partitus]
MDAKEIVRGALQMEKLNSERRFEDIMSLLADLDESHITAEQLETTDVVQLLYRILKTCSDSDVKKKVKSLLSKWKRQYSKDAKGGKCTEDPAELPPFRSDAGQTCDNKEENAAEQEAASLQAKSSLQTLTSASSDSVRTKCVELLLAALHPEPPDRDKAAELAGGIEQHIHELHNSNQVKYKACVRSKVANLRNPKSSHLRQGLLSGSLPPEAFARMSAEEMASQELRQLREEFSSRGVSERQLPQAIEGTQTQKIRCKRCGGSDCRVTQVSRGALFLPAWVRSSGPDDDAMTFVTCSGCGQQWYHSGWVCL